MGNSNWKNDTVHWEKYFKECFLIWKEKDGSIDTTGPIITDEVPTTEDRNTVMLSIVVYINKWKSCLNGRNCNEIKFEREGMWYCLLWRYENMNMKIITQKKSSQKLKLTLKMKLST